MVYNCENQKVVSNIDSFIYEFFSLSDSDFIDKKNNIIDNNDFENIINYRKLSKNENIFSVLISCDWSDYPFNISHFFNRIRKTG